MISPYASKIAFTKKDIEIVTNALGSLGKVSAALDDLNDSLSNLGTHISAGFNVSCVATGVATEPRNQLEDSRTILMGAKTELEAELASLVLSDETWKSKQEQAKLDSVS